MNNKTTIAADNALAQQHSDQLKNLIAAEIGQQDGFISFADYMQHCLYQPGLGYYSAGSHKLGQGEISRQPPKSVLYLVMRLPTMLMMHYCSVKTETFLSLVRVAASLPLRFYPVCKY